jgi:transaldolase/glucose-6-phosphate isomerase
MGSSLEDLQSLGQSVWLDYISRSLIADGELQQLVYDDGVRGVTSNPAICEKAIAGSTAYGDILSDPHSRKLDAKGLYETIAVRDIQEAADILLPIYDRTSRRDGYVSLEVSPKLARDARGTIEEARRLWKTVARPNLMVKVPATPEGIVAIRQLISEAINVNVTLLFSQETYAQVVEAYLAGLEDRAASGANIEGIASVASFFISRIDSVVDARVREQNLSRSLLGKVAIANARLTYQRYRELFSGPRWFELENYGAQTQRVLWASTGTKDPAYRDVLYVEELIGPDTVNTMPPATLAAFRDHGIARASLCEDVEGAAETMSQLAQQGIAIDEVTDLLLEQGVRLFNDAFDKLLTAVRQRAGMVVSGMVDLDTSETVASDLAPRASPADKRPAGS